MIDGVFGRERQLIEEKELLHLIQKVQRGDQLAFEEIHRHFELMIHKYAHLYPIPEYEHDDFVQEATVVLFKAISRFSVANGISFPAYFKRCLKNEVFSMIRHSLAKKRAGRRKTVSLEPIYYRAEMDQDERWLDFGFPSPEDQLVINEVMEEYLTLLSPYESVVFKAYLDGATIEEIAKSVKSSPKKATNALRRCRQKLKNTLAS